MAKNKEAEIAKQYRDKYLDEATEKATFLGQSLSEREEAISDYIDMRHQKDQIKRAERGKEIADKKIKEKQKAEGDIFRAKKKEESEAEYRRKKAESSKQKDTKPVEKLEAINLSRRGVAGQPETTAGGIASGLMGGGTGDFKPQIHIYDNIDNVIQKRMKAQGSLTSLIYQQMEAAYGVTPQQIREDLTTDTDRYIQEKRRGLVDAETPQIDQPSLPPQAASMAAQMAMGMLGDLFASQTTTRAPMQTVSSQVIGQATDTFAQKKASMDSLKQSVYEKNIALLQADTKQKALILDSMSATEKGLMDAANVAYATQVSKANAILTTLSTNYATESTNFNSAYNRNSQERMTEARLKVERERNAISAFNAGISAKKFENNMKKQNLQLSGLSPAEVRQIISTNYNLYGFDGAPMTTLMQSLSGNYKDIEKFSGNGTTYGKDIERVWNSVKEEAFNRHDSGDFFGTSKGQRVNAANDAGAKFMNTMALFTSTGRKVNPDFIRQHQGSIMVNLDTGALIVTEKDKEVLTKAIRRDTLFTENEKDRTYFKLMVKHMDYQSKGKQFMNSDDLNKVTSYLTNRGALEQADRNSPMEAVYGQINAYQNIAGKAENKALRLRSIAKGKDTSKAGSIADAKTELLSE